MKKVCFLLALLLLLSGCSGEPVPSQPTTTEPLPSSSAAPTETKWPYNPEWEGCEVITPEEGVLIFYGEETVENKVIDGDIYVTANAVVTLRDVQVAGATYCHGKLILDGRFSLGPLFAYKENNKGYAVVSSSYDGIHGEILYGEKAGGGGGKRVFTEDALDYAFETWGKAEPVEQPPMEFRGEYRLPSGYDPADVRILSGKQNLISETIDGDVYITSDGDITFYDVKVGGNLYVYGKLNLSTYAETENRIGGYLYAYDFGVTCEAFDGTHGQVTGGPVWCGGYVVANDALDYAFDTWGKQ